MRQPFPALQPRYNIAPSQQVPVIRLDAQGYCELVMLKWGLLPRWSKEPKSGYSMINARADTVASKPAFRYAFRHHRCLVPASGFYEWRKIDARRQPYYVRAQDGGPFCFAGLWEHWKSPDGSQTIDSCTIIVTDANELLAPIHDRMPVILPEDAYLGWLNPATSLETLQQMLRPYPARLLTAYPVSPRVNSPQFDDPTLLEALAKP